MRSPSSRPPPPPGERLPRRLSRKQCSSGRAPHKGSVALDPAAGALPTDFRAQRPLSSASTFGTSGGSSRARNPSRPMDDESRSPARPCRKAPQTAACAGSAPRASSPAVMPARTSPEPETPRPELPLSSCQSRPSGVAIHDVAPPSPTTACARPARSRAAPSGSFSISSSSTCSARAISVGLGVNTTRPRRCCTQATSAVTQASARASSASGPERSGSSRAPNSWISSASAMPGPMRTASAPVARSRTVSAASALIPPDPVSGRPRTRASGSAAAANGATEAAVATWSLPAPARIAASPASSTAPRVSALPPITRTEPRAFFPPVGSGSGQPRRSSEVTSVGSGVLGGIGLLRDVLGLGDDVLDLVEGDQPEAAVGVALVAGQGGVGDLLLLVDGQQLLLGELLQHVPEHHDHGLVGDDQQPLAVVAQALGRQQAADPQRDVGPALPARRPVVELAEQVAPPRLVGELLPDAGPGHAVERPEVALAQPLVGAHADVQLRRGQLGGGQRPVERGAQRGGGPVVVGQVGQPRAQRLGLRVPGVGQLDVGIADVELQPARSRLLRLRVG